MEMGSCSYDTERTPVSTLDPPFVTQKLTVASMRTAPCNERFIVPFARQDYGIVFGTLLYVGQAPCQSSKLLNCLDHKVAVEGLGFRVWDVELGLGIRSAVYNMDCFIQDLTRCCSLQVQDI